MMTHYREPLRKGAILGILIASVATGARAQSCPPPRSAVRQDSLKPDIALFARVHADELRFASKPDVTIKLAGCPQIDSTHLSVRTNLPRPVQPGVTYRNVTVDFRLAARFSELECVLADLLPAIGADSSALAGARRACVQRDTIRSR